MRPKRNEYPDDRIGRLGELNEHFIEDKIIDECTGYVAEKMGITENLARKLHDFQWAQVKKAADEYKTVYVSKFFKLVLRENKVNKFIKDLQKKKQELEDIHFSLEGEDKWKMGHQITAVQQQIDTLQQQLKKCTQPKK